MCLNLFKSVAIQLSYFKGCLNLTDNFARILRCKLVEIYAERNLRIWSSRCKKRSVFETFCESQIPTII